MLAAVLWHRRRLVALVAAASLAAALVTTGVLILTRPSAPEPTQPHPKLAEVLTPPDGNIAQQVAFSPDGTTLAVGDDNYTTYLWNIPTGRLIATLSAPANQFPFSVARPAFSPDGRTLAIAEDGDVNLWNVATRSRFATLTDGLPSPALFGGAGGLNSVAFSPDGKTLAAGDGDGDIYLFSVATHRVIAQAQQRGDGSPYVVGFSPDGKTLATQNVQSAAVVLWNVATMRVVGTVKADAASQRLTPDDPDEPFGVNSVVFSRDGSTLAAVDENGSVYLWRAIG